MKAKVLASTSNLATFARSLFFVLVVMVSFICLSKAFGAADPVIPFSAKITDRDSHVIDGQRTLMFSLYTNSNTTNVLWCEVHTNASIANGILSVNLGSAASLASISLGEDLWLGIKVGTDAEMSPRVRIPAQSAGVPRGTIIMWSGNLANIPAGWLLCDGSNGTPDLRGRFVRGADANNSVGTIGGTVDHEHTGTTNPWNAGTTRIDDNSGGSDYDWPNPQGHSHSFTTSKAGHLPPYLALGFLMKR